MLEEDLFFPGKPLDNDDESDVYSDSSHRDVSLSEVDQDSLAIDTDSSVATHSGSSSKSDDSSLTTAPSSAKESPLTSPYSNSPPTRHVIPTGGEDQKTTPTFHDTHNSRRIVISPYSRSANRPNLYVKTQTSSNGLSQLHVPLTRAPPPSKYGESTASLISAIGGVTPADDYRYKTPLVQSFEASSSSVGGDLSPPEVSKLVQRTPPFLLRTLAKPPPNPRNHTLLEMIYEEMLASRFINIAPLSILANVLGLHFKGSVIRLVYPHTNRY